MESLHQNRMLKGAELLGIAPEDCIVIEDTPVGIQSGRKAGARVLALRTTVTDSLLAAAVPDWAVQD